MNWTPSPWFLAEVNHVLAACLLVVVVAWRGWNVRLAAFLVLLFAGLKEFWADFTWLESDSTAGSVADFAFYAVGVAGGLATSRWFWVGVGLVVAAIVGLTGWDILAPLTEPQ